MFVAVFAVLAKFKNQGTSMQWSETNESWHDKLIDQYAHSWMNEQQIVVFNYFPPLTSVKAL